jgi:urease accessory protein UreH
MKIKGYMLTWEQMEMLTDFFQSQLYAGEEHIYSRTARNEAVKADTIENAVKIYADLSGEQLTFEKFQVWLKYELLREGARQAENRTGFDSIDIYEAILTTTALA